MDAEGSKCLLSNHYQVANYGPFFAVIVGMLLWSAFNWSLEVTNAESFCISCHEREANVYAEYKNSVHYANRTGVRASCPDCHEPRS